MALPLRVLVLAAGKSTRMKSEKSKVLHEVAGRPMLEYVLRAASALKPDRTVVVIGHQGDEVREAFRDWPGIVWARQKKMIGTGDAVRSAMPEWSGFSGTVLVLYGDIPGVRTETLRLLIREHEAGDRAVTLLTMKLDDPKSYGRIVTDPSDLVERIVEEKDATSEERKIREVNSGIVAYRSRFLSEKIMELKAANAQGEFYLTDLVELARRSGERVGRVIAQSPEELQGINSQEELIRLSERMERKGA